jgi:cyclohexanone monooxygenase
MIGTQPSAAQETPMQAEEHDTPPLAALIIGTGFAGLGMAIALRKAGILDFVIVERSQDVGGVWRDNTYPGAACDVPSHLYSFSFEPKPDWSRTFAPQAEILGYLQHCARKYELLPHIRFGSEVASAAWDEATSTWRVTLTDGRVYRSTVLVTGAGQLSRPSLPALPGIETFRGPSFHSARWDHAVPLAGRRVAVVGTGASAIQFVPAIAPQVGHLDVFQRSPAWMLPRTARAYGPLAKAVFRHVPGATRLLRASIYLAYESRAIAFTRFKGLMKLAGGVPFQRMLKAQVPDAALRAKLTPDYQIGCKRILLSSEYLATMTRPNVHLQTTAIRCVRPEGIETVDGVVHPADVIVYGTGFAATQFLAPMRITGRGGVDLNDAWRAGASAWLGIAVAGFPNFFMLYGPNTNLGHNSIVYMLESQIAHVMRCLRAARHAGATAVEVRADRQDGYARSMQQALQRTVWNGCTSWYLDANGRNTVNWPGFTFTYRWRTRFSGLGAYRFERPLADVPGGVTVAPPPGALEAFQAAFLRAFLRVTFRAFVGPPFGPGVQRGVVALLSPLMPGVGGVRRARQRLGGVPSEVVTPHGDDTGPVMLYLHGGAFCLGSPHTHRSITTRLAREGRMTVHVPDYRLAPEHPQPAPLDDALACYEALLQQGVAPGRLVVAGDSAGGSLALSLALELKRRGLPLPAALMLLSPLVDTSLQTARATAGTVRDPMLRMGWLEQGALWHGSTPAASGRLPTVEELAGLPPMLIQVGDEELLLADSRALASRARAAGVDVGLEVHQRRWHVFHLQAFFLASSRAALARGVAFARMHAHAGLARPPAQAAAAAQVGAAT